MRIKYCHICKAQKNTMFRVKLDSSKNWYFLCKDCTEENKSKNSHYIYGGTWKA